MSKSNRIRFRLEEIDFSSPTQVCDIAMGFQRELFPDSPNAFIARRFASVEDMFAGRYKGFQPMDTAYHDLEHTLQATLCLLRLLVNRQHSDAQPKITDQDFNIALIAILLHDIGYLKELDDTEGTGAKYTHIHERRSCRHARAYLMARDWTPENISKVEHLISCTGPSSDITKIPFSDPVERMLGQSVCTADFIGQMSDPRYVEKLPVLYREFRENYTYRKVKPEDRLFSSYEDLLRKTPEFWENFVHYKMNVQCDNQWQYFKDPETGEDAYLPNVEANIDKVRDLITQLPAV